MERTIMLDGKEVRMRASALIPRLYRFKFGRDMVQDMNALIKAFRRVQNLPKDATEDERQDAQLSALDLTVFENVSWLFIRHAGEDIPDNPDDWLDSIDGVFSIYEIMPTIMELWNANQQTTSVPAKK